MNRTCKCRHIKSGMYLAANFFDSSGKAYKNGKIQDVIRDLFPAAVKSTFATEIPQALLTVSFFQESAKLVT